MKIIQKNGVAVVELKGRIAYDNLQDIQETLNRLVQSDLSQVVLKMDRTQYLDSSALQMLLNFNQAAYQAGIDTLITQPSSTIQALFAYAQLDHLFQLVSRAELESITGPSDGNDSSA